MSLCSLSLSIRVNYTISEGAIDGLERKTRRDVRFLLRAFLSLRDGEMMTLSARLS